MKKALIGYQIYSAREEAEKDLFGVLKHVKELGYDGVEFAGMYDYTAEEIKKALDEAGIIGISAHVPLAVIEQDMFKTISDYKTIGVKYIAVPYTDDLCRPGGEKFAETLQLMTKFGRLCKEAGIQLLYHNHDFEFVKISGIYGLDFIYQAIDACTLKTEIDTCWVKYAGEDPAAYVRKYAGRCPVVHLKDYVGVKGGKNPYALIGMEDDSASPDEIAFEFRPVGHGCQDVPAIVEAGLESGAEWFIVEQDLSVGRPPLEACKMSIEYLKSIGM